MEAAKDAEEKDAAFVAGIKEARAKGFKEKEALMQEAADEEKKIIADYIDFVPIRSER